MLEHGLSERQLNIIAHVLKPFIEKIQRVDVFGSRATGAYRPNSDIDLVIHGDLGEADQDRLYTMFGESNLSIGVDVNIYDLVTWPKLKAHIDAVGKTLFTQNELKRRIAEAENTTVEAV